MLRWVLSPHTCGGADTSQQSLARELQIWSKFKHANILDLTGFYLDESSLAEASIATPWMKNGNLSQFLAARNPDWEVRLKLVRDQRRLKVAST